MTDTEHGDNQSGGANLNSGTDTNVGGDVVGRDKVTSITIGPVIVGGEKERPPGSSPDEGGSTLLRIPIPIWAAALGAIAIIVAALISRTPMSLAPTPSPTPSPTPACISAADIIVAAHILKGTSELAALSPRDTIAIEPDLTIYVQAVITSVTDGPLPTLECAWTNTGIATEGSLLHITGCRIDYRSGRSVIMDAVSLQLRQAACPALAPYPFFITPKP